MPYSSFPVPRAPVHPHPAHPSSAQGSATFPLFLTPRKLALQKNTCSQSIGPG